jgi:hypothetical protein
MLSITSIIVFKSFTTTTDLLPHLVLMVAAPMNFRVLKLLRLIQEAISILPTRRMHALKNITATIHLISHGVLMAAAPENLHLQMV